MKCPHCQVEIHNTFHAVSEDHVDERVTCDIFAQNCPACERLLIALVYYTGDEDNRRQIIYPHASSRPKPPAEVPDEFAQDYIEAALVLTDSPKASAALSRRCLQHVLREKAGVKHANLATEIQQVIDGGQLPSHLAESIDAIRNIGNFAAHPMKSTASGEVLPVETGEAEWNLDVLDRLFDFYFVQPAILLAKKTALNAKLAKAGKPQMK